MILKALKLSFTKSKPLLAGLNGGLALRSKLAALLKLVDSKALDLRILLDPKPVCLRPLVIWVIDVWVRLAVSI